MGQTRSNHILGMYSMTKHRQQKAKKSFFYLDFLNILPRQALSLTSWCMAQHPAKRCAVVNGCTVPKKPGEGSEISYQGLLINVLSICWLLAQTALWSGARERREGGKTLWRPYIQRTEEFQLQVTKLGFFHHKLSLHRSLLLEETCDQSLKMITGQPQGSLAQQEGAKPMRSRMRSSEKRVTLTRWDCSGLVEITTSAIRAETRAPKSPWSQIQKNHVTVDADSGRSLWDDFHAWTTHIHLLQHSWNPKSAARNLWTQSPAKGTLEQPTAHGECETLPYWRDLADRKSVV